MHSWGDDWPCWDDLYNAQSDIQKVVKRWSRCKLITKEKYGTIRYEYIFHPGSRLFYRFRSKPNSRLRTFEFKLYEWWSCTSLIGRVWTKWGCYLAKRKVLSICKAKPYLCRELLEDMVGDERFGFPKYYKKLLGWKSSDDWDWNRED